MEDLWQKMNSQHLIVNAVLTKVTESARKTGQTEAAVNTFRDSIENVKNLIEKSNEGLVKKLETSASLVSMGKKLNANAESLRKLQDQIQMLQSVEKEEKVVSFEEGHQTPEQAKVEEVLDDFWSSEDLTLVAYLKSDMGRNMYRLLALMENSETKNVNELESWWKIQKIRWSDVKQNKHGLITMYRAFSWWAAQFEAGLTNLLTGFMVNPFAASLQELCHQAAILRNLLHSMGFISGGDAKVKWAEPFIAAGKFC